MITSTLDLRTALPASFLILSHVLVVEAATLDRGTMANYREPWRPQFHFSPATNWMNDPNGMVYYEGEYHLFYQFNPFGTKWGHMSWGHAVSRDLVHWEQLPIALYEENDVMIFSGSAVVDWKNTSGFGKNGKPPLVAIYTGHYTKKPLQNQHIAFSNDRGRSWTKFAGNPVLDIGEKDFRDPKVIWHEPTARWVMSVVLATERKVRFYASPNLKEWTHLSDFGPAGSTSGIWECPDLFPLRVEGRRSTEKWVLVINVGSGGPAGGVGCQYFVGAFDGKQFTLDEMFPKPAPEFVPEGKVLADFERGDYAGWRASGSAFGTAPASGAIGSQQKVDGFRGQGLVNSFLDGDKAEGTLTSPQFEITHNHISFLVGGGNHPDKTCVNLVIDGQVFRSATGDAAERLAWKSWDVRDLRGRKSTIEIVDRHSGGWGHINVDHILLADTPARPATQPVAWADFGADFYAGVAWSDIPKRDGRSVWIGWMNNWQYAGDLPTSVWRGQMSVPRELKLRETYDGLRLVQTPVRELEKLRGKRHRLGRSTFDEARDWLKTRKFSSEMLEVETEIEAPAKGDGFGFVIETSEGEQTSVRFDLASRRVSLDRSRSGKTGFHRAFPASHHAPLRSDGRRVTMRLLLDISSIEVFANGGETVLTDLIFPSAPGRTLQMFSDGAAPGVTKLDVWELKTIWR